MIGCIRRKTGRLGQAGRKDRLYQKEDRQAGKVGRKERLYKKEDRQAGAWRQERQAGRNKEASRHETPLFPEKCECPPFEGRKRTMRMQVVLERPRIISVPLRVHHSADEIWMAEGFWAGSVTVREFLLQI
jgi:hypothetical protein